MWEKFFVMDVDDMKWLKNCIDLNYIFLNLILVLLYWKVCIVNKIVFIIIYEVRGKGGMESFF